jgi:hypothetical protein
MKCAQPDCTGQVEPNVSGRPRRFCPAHSTNEARALRSYHRRKLGLPPLCKYERQQQSS